MQSRAVSHAVAALLKAPNGARLTARTWSRRTLSDETLLEFLDAARGADALVIQLMGSEDSFSLYRQVLAEVTATPIITKRGPRVASVIGSQLGSEVDAEIGDKVARFIDYGGQQNTLGLLTTIANAFGDADFAPAEPSEQPWDGIYHPRLGGVTQLESYLAQVHDPTTWTAAILFHRPHLLTGNTELVDAVISEVERKGGNALPIFLMTGINSQYGNPDYRESLPRYLQADDGPRADVLINLLAMPIGYETSAAPHPTGDDDAVLADLQLPIIKGVVTSRTRQDWESSLQGIDPSNLVIQFSYPEFAGMLAGPPVGFHDDEIFDPVTQSNQVRTLPHPERIERLVSQAANWARLRRTPAAHTKVALVLHNYPPRDDTIATASGLDSPASIIRLMHAMQAAGYNVGAVPADGAALIEQLLTAATNDRRWVSPEVATERAAAHISPLLSSEWFEDLPAAVQDDVLEKWGPPPGHVLSGELGITVPGVRFGNLFIAIQPTRGLGEDLASEVHDPYLPIGHHYSGVYRWLREEFGAHAAIHFGTHGSLEWLPGKGLGLSASCQPDIAIADLPNIYPYIVNNPGEGTQAKRRSAAALVGHMSPPLATAGDYGQLSDLDHAIDEYREAVDGGSGRVTLIADRVWQLFTESYLDHDLEIAARPDATEFAKLVAHIDNHLSYLKETQITIGLHTLGLAPQGERLIEHLLAMLRHPIDEITSLRQLGATALGLRLDELLADPAGGYLTTAGKRATFGAALDAVQQWSIDFLSDVVAEASSAEQQLAEMPSAEDCAAAALSRAANHALRRQEPASEVLPALSAVAQYVRADLLPRIQGVGAELESILDALAGRRIAPGPSGAASKASPEVLPTGRNFFSVNPRSIPTADTWQIGVALAEDLIARYQSDQGGNTPEQIAIVLRAVPTMRSKGEDVAEVLHLLGVRPVWSPRNGQITGLEVLPVAELGRPRIDVTARITGLMRDTFANLVDLIDEAIELVGFLDEPDEDNFVAKHIRASMRAMAANGVPVDQAKRRSRYRLFGDQPGVYGAGPDKLVETQQWESRAELGEAFIEWGAYAYGRDDYGTRAEHEFRGQLGAVDAAVRNIDTRETDILGCSCQYGYFGGLIAAVESVTGSQPASYFSDTTDAGRVRTRTVRDEVKMLLRTKILNPKWVESMREHGYKGAGDISKKVDRLFGWDATAATMDDWMYDDLADTFARDAEVEQWLDEVNPAAKYNIIERLLEANQRGMWRTDQARLDDLRSRLLDAEGDLETGASTR
ncbi:MAG: cobaltochelatase subunit CobN [Leucobacter sp.]|nr:cobaltochelatase subunit CobN [Leucobacter sp.]